MLRGDLEMKCSKCGSENVNIQLVPVTKNKKSFIYWLFIGWWFEMIMWLFLTLPWLIIKIFKPRKTTTKIQRQAVCQSCGNTWRL